MKALKRWTTSISSSFDWVISQVENHETLVGSAIREMQHASAKAKMQLNRVKKDGSAMRERLAELKEAEKLWQDRALSVHTSDPQKALECIRRKKRSEREIKAIEGHIKEHRKLEKQLSGDLETIHSRISELKRKKNAFAARQYRAEAAQAGQREDIGLITEIDEIFDRWEGRLAQCEAFESVPDGFEDDFLQEEEDQQLEAELEALIKQVS